MVDYATEEELNRTGNPWSQRDPETIRTAVIQLLADPDALSADNHVTWALLLCVIDRLERLGDNLTKLAQPPPDDD